MIASSTDSTTANDTGNASGRAQGAPAGTARGASQGAGQGEASVGGDDRQYCTFHVDRMFFGVEVLSVQEVIRFQELTGVPTAPSVVSGLINLRGQIVTAIDLRARLGLPPLPADRRPMNVVVRTDDGAVSLLVDEIGDVLQVDAAARERPPATIPPKSRELIRDVYKLKDGLLLVLDTGRAVELAA